jgi:hypothetical protein
MGLSLNRNGALRLRLGDADVGLRFRRPEPAELIEALARKMPRGDEAADASRALLANLELGRRCVEGVGPGELEIDGAALSTDPAAVDYREDWREVLAAVAPLLLIALGQFLSTPPAFLSEPALKKTSATPA